MDGDVRVTTCETAWTRRKHTAIDATVTVTVDGAYVDVDRVAKPPYCFPTNSVIQLRVMHYCLLDHMYCRLSPISTKKMAPVYTVH